MRLACMPYSVSSGPNLTCHYGMLQRSWTDFKLDPAFPIKAPEIEDSHPADKVSPDESRMRPAYQQAIVALSNRRTFKFGLETSAGQRTMLEFSALISDERGSYAQMEQMALAILLLRSPQQRAMHGGGESCNVIK